MTRHSDSGVAIQRRIQKAAGPFAVLRCVAIEQHRGVETIDFGYLEAMGKGLSLPQRDLKVVFSGVPIARRRRGNTCNCLDGAGNRPIKNRASIDQLTNQRVKLSGLLLLPKDDQTVNGQE